MLGFCIASLTFLSSVIENGEEERAEFVERFHFNLSDALPLADVDPHWQAITTQASKHRPKLASHPQNFVLVLDFWERMVNVQSALKRIVQIGVDADFAVVEPFVYESKVARRLSLPDHFESQGLIPQSVDQYFDTDELFTTNNFVRYNDFSHLTKQISSGFVFIDVALLFDWDNSTEARNPYWCHERLSELGLSPAKGARTSWHLSKTVVVGGALCLSPTVTMAPQNISAYFFDNLFRTVRQYSLQNNASKSGCYPTCASLAFLNYRKHAFTGYVSSTGLRPFENRSPPMRIGRPPMDVAKHLHATYFERQPFVALQMRTGKAWVLSGREDARFIPWLSSCVEQVLSAAKAAGETLSNKSIDALPRFYIASDMYNSGWKGGETCSPAACKALARARSRIEADLRPVRFIPGDHNINQDTMGMSSAVDAAMCLMAERFVYASPSNLGRWVKELRDAYFQVGTTNVKCDVFRGNR
jgi:hypothetical protein